MTYCMANRRVRNVIRSAPKAPPPDPYALGSAGYAERHQETVTELAGGIVRVDMGEPITGLKLNARAAPARKVVEVVPNVPPPPPAPPTARKAPMGSPKISREHRAISRNP